MKLLPPIIATIHQALIALACLLCGFSLAHASVTIEQQPLVVAQPLPPNIVFIMDDSGSMAWQHMPGTAASWTSSPPSGLPHSSMNNDIRLRAANINTQWYDPAKNYLPWKQWNGSSWGDIDPSSAPYDPSETVTSGSHNLRQTSYPSSPNSSNRDSTSVTSSSGRAFRFQGFYVHQGGSVTSNSNYKRFDFRWNNSRSRWEGRYCNWNTWGNDTNLSNCDYYVGNNTQGPFGRSMADEVQNYANWFSYYRLRASMAKAAASRVFADLGENFRVGYRTLHNRQTLNIPVQTDTGLFRSTNKEDWFDRLFKTNANSGTPLRQALGNVGEYFSQTGNDGPWGPAPQLSCRQNFSILTTDGYWNGSAASASGARQDTDSSDGPTITGPNGQSYTYTASRPYRDGRSNTLADTAMYYWKNDLRTDLKNDVPTSTANPAFWQHMVTFGISMGEKGILDPSTDLPKLRAGTEAWPEPGNDRTANIDDLWHAAINSRGEFIVASDADAFVDSLNSALGTIASRLGSGASLASNSTKLEEGTRTYQAQYWSGAWRGELNAFDVNTTTGALSANPVWQASEQLPANWQNRKIYFHEPTGSTPANKLKLFTFDNLSSDQRTALRNSSNLVDYLRGRRNQEESVGGPFRNRASALGDIINSQPVYVGAPNSRLFIGSNFSGAAGYGSFALGRAGRTPVVYVGANDGMLHGFNANTGEETFAFIPNTVIRNGLATLSDPDYEHRYFVDGELTVADTYSAAGGWKTVLVGTLGRGGRGIFALDVTDPHNVKFLWEKNASDIPELGNVLGRPVIAQMGNGNWRVLLGNGPNGSGDSAQLIMIGVDSGNVSVIDTGVSGNNGLSAVSAWDSNGDGLTDTVYAGDLRGNLWRFSGLPAGTSTERLFSARTAGGAVQPITATPLTGRNPDTGEIWVFFGTGQYLNQNDLTNMQVQSWYGLIDRGNTIPSRNDLVVRSILAEGEINGFGARVVDEGRASDLTDKSGWVMDLRSPQNGVEGERMVVPNLFRARVLIGTTRIPDSSDPCNPSGRGYIMAIDPFTGARLSQTFFDVTMDGLFNDADRLMVNGVLTIVSGIGFNASPNNPLFVGNVMQFSLEDGTTGSMQNPEPLGIARRQSWRELIGD